MVAVPQAWSWLAIYAEKHGLSYEPDADERWLRAFEPFVTLRTPHGYAHSLSATGSGGSLSLARLIVGEDAGPPERTAWIAIAQDDRLPGPSAPPRRDATPPSPFAEDPELVSVPRRRTGDGVFDRVFAAYSPSDDDLARAVTPSVRKLVLSWRIPLHFEIRPGAFILSPVALPADPASLAWLLGAVQFFGEKAAKRVK